MPSGNSDRLWLHSIWLDRRETLSRPFRHNPEYCLTCVSLEWNTALINTEPRMALLRSYVQTELVSYLSYRRAFTRAQCARVKNASKHIFKTRCQHVTSNVLISKWTYESWEIFKIWLFREKCLWGNLTFREKRLWGQWHYAVQAQNHLT